MNTAMIYLAMLLQPTPPPAHLAELRVHRIPAWYYDPAQRIPPAYVSPLDGSVQPNTGPLTQPEIWRIILEGN